ncbi:hypothetical protein [Brackiella oedipodis]|uniref:hypothetical protein n=1 Tax=Brackiella oedipodis TaxID=124225 RepID=UPI0012EB9EF7|nr:hypothetical protein [Brackiella oedipodis]
MKAINYTETQLDTRLHDPDCQCHSCMMLSALTRSFRVLAALVVLWLAAFLAMGWLPF